jgi:hypothetical protein
LLASVTQPQPATLATPSGAETQPGPESLASGESDQGATEAPVITPAAESVARTEQAVGSGNGNVEESEPAEGKPEESAASDALDAPHDYKQPA